MLLLSITELIREILMDILKIEIVIHYITKMTREVYCSAGSLYSTFWDLNMA
jgi:hypothetical protein